MAQTLAILPPIVLGAIVGIYEMILVQRDVSVPQHRFGHAVHAFIFAIVGTFISFNVPFVLSLIPALASIPFIGTVIGIRIAIAVIMALKVHGVSAALKSSGMMTAGMGETWTHSLIIGVLTAFVPYVFPYIAPLLPIWLK
jgi:hypothetical protein